MTQSNGGASPPAHRLVVGRILVGGEKRLLTKKKVRGVKYEHRNGAGSSNPSRRIFESFYRAEIGSFLGNSVV
jgi:hypothetical protein